MCTYIPSIIAQGATSRVELIDILLTRRFLFVCIWCESEVLLRLARNVWFAVLCSHERLLRMLPCCRISPLASILNVDQSCRSSVILGGGRKGSKNEGLIGMPCCRCVVYKKKKASSPLVCWRPNRGSHNQCRLSFVIGFHYVYFFALKHSGTEMKHDLRRFA